MRPLLVTCALLLGLTACGGADDEEQPAPLPAESTGSPTGAPTAYDEYVAIGDSYTAAPLVPPTDTSSICLRSGANYPALVAAAMPGTALTDVSCSGATTANTVEPQSGMGGSVPPQFDALTPTTDLVTIGLGGNDESLFAKLLGRCTELASQDPTGAPCEEAAAGGVDFELLQSTIRDNLADVVRGVRERSPEARILMIGYPQLVPGSGTCDLLPLAEGDYPFARAVNEGLNQAMSDAAEVTDAEYVDVWEPSAGHDICADEPWVNGRVTSAATALAYHPLAVGQEAVAELVLEQLG